MDINQLLIVALALGLLLVIVLATYLYTLRKVNRKTSQIQRKINERITHRDKTKQAQKQPSVGKGVTPSVSTRSKKPGLNRWTEDDNEHVPDLVDLMIEDTEQLGSPPENDLERPIYRNPLHNSGDNDTNNTKAKDGDVLLAPFPSSSSPEVSEKKRQPSIVRPSSVHLYPGSEVEPSKVRVSDWDKPDPSYRAVPYTASQVLSDPNADPGMVSLQRPGMVLFNQLDTNVVPALDRRSHEGIYAVESGMPLCPAGRQGISGRGLFPRWGPNHQVVVLLCRKKTKEDGSLVINSDTGHPVQQVLAVYPEDDRKFLHLPSTPSHKGDDTSPAYKALVQQTLALDTEAKFAVIEELKSSLQHRETIVYQGILVDQQTTDNAWAETLAVTFDLGKGTMNNDFDRNNLIASAEWVDTTNVTRFSKGHRQLVAKLVELHIEQENNAHMPQPTPPPEDDLADVAAQVEPPREPESESEQEPEPVQESEQEPEPEPEPEPEAQQLPAQEESPEPRERLVSNVEGNTIQMLASHVLGKVPEVDENSSVPLPEGVAAKQMQDLEDLDGVETNSFNNEKPGASEAAAPPAKKSGNIRRFSREETERRARLSSQKEKFVEQQKYTMPPAGAPNSGMFRQRKEGEIKVDLCTFMGSVGGNAYTGKELHQREVIRAIKVLKGSGAREHKLVRIIIGADGIDIEEPPAIGTSEKDLKKMKSNDQALLNVASKLIKNIPIRNIAFTGTDPKQKKMFCFVATDPKTQTTETYVFESRTKGKYLIQAVAAAFNQAVQIKTDPFALKRYGEITPDAAGMAVDFKGHELSRSQLDAKIIIGHGQYGKVYLADYRPQSDEPTKVAVKLMRPELSHVDGKDFLSEAASMLAFEHPKLLQLLGVCIEKKPWLIVVNFMHYKDLGIVLRQCRKHSVLLHMHEMLTFCEQVADGMCYMADLRFIHRDLAARNILLSHQNIVRIGDFGLARKLADDKDYWRLDKAGRLPVKYMAVETLTSKRFSFASDVWAFAVFCWEVMTYGEIPWSREGIANVDIKNAVSAGHRLGKPEMKLLSQEMVSRADSPDGEGTGYLDVGSFKAEEMWDRWYEMLRECWAHKPEDRPTFVRLRQELREKLDMASGALPPPRDVGAECYEALEKSKSGGAVIRAAPTLKRGKGSEQLADGIDL